MLYKDGKTPRQIAQQNADTKSDVRGFLHDLTFKSKEEEGLYLDVAAGSLDKLQDIFAKDKDAIYKTFGKDAGLKSNRKV